tara:strand:- start:2262 stop:2474 length:213 start_codon:yes stop_codon:yes gene_type:complete
VDAMGRRRESDGVLPRTARERLGELVECKWMYGMCVIVDYEDKDFYSLLKVYQFDTHDYFWVDEEDVEKF